MLRQNAWVRASVFYIEREKTSLAAIIVKGTSGPSDCAMPIKNILSAKQNTSKIKFRV
jgi:hypothetical protein